MQKFIFAQPIGSNFTPAQKIKEYADLCGIPTSDNHGTTVIRVANTGYAYSSYTIEPLSIGWEKVTIFLEEVS